MNLRMYLESKKRYEEILNKVQPGNSMSEQEHVAKTAQYVGLQVPDAG